MTEDTTSQQPILGGTIAEPGPPSLSEAYRLPDIAAWLYQALKDTLAQYEGETPLTEMDAPPTDARMALAVYEDWTARMGEGQGF